MLYCAVALVFAGVCATFVALYITVNLNVFVCFFVNFIVSVVFVWFSVIFFKIKFSLLRDDVRFYRMQENALINYARGAFRGAEGEGKEGGLCFCYLTFETAEGLKKYRLKQGIKVPFAQDKLYDLELAGDLVTGYAEAENE